MPTPVRDLGSPEANFFEAFWRAVGEDLRGEAPVFGQVPMKDRGLPASERAIIEKEQARQRAEEFVISPNFVGWVVLTSRFVDQPIDPEDMLEALYAGRK